MGEVSRRELDMAANASGPTIGVATRLTSAPEAGRRLSVAAGEGAEALANAARGDGKLFTAQIPQALLQALEKVGMVRQSVTEMNGVRAIEYKFFPQATEFVVQFFHEETRK
jgi:hypothetical protein